MAADLHIHILVDPCTVDDLRTMSGGVSSYNMDRWRAAYERVSKTPSVHVGEVSWLKATILDDSESFIPDAVAAVSDAIPDKRPTHIDDTLIAKVRDGMGLSNRTTYDISEAAEVVTFLERHKGDLAFTISW